MASRAGYIMKPWVFQLEDDYNEWASCLHYHACKLPLSSRARLICSYLENWIWDLMGPLDWTANVNDQELWNKLNNFFIDKIVFEFSPEPLILEEACVVESVMNSEITEPFSMLEEVFLIPTLHNYSECCATETQTVLTSSHKAVLETCSTPEFTQSPPALEQSSIRKERSALVHEPTLVISPTNIPRSETVRITYMWYLSHLRLEHKLTPLNYDSGDTVIEIPFDQRRFQNDDQQTSGRRYDAQNRICSEIVKETGVEISLNTSKLNMLTVILSGHPSKVLLAKQKVIGELRQQETTKLNVPQEYHAFLIGRRGERLRELQTSTMTRISVPPSNAADSNTIVITGPKQGIIDAEQQIREIVERQSQQGFERLDIPKIYHTFICGPNNQLVDELRERTDAKINIPPRNIPAHVITLSGKRDGVAKAASEIRAIYEQALLFKTIPVCVKKSQHHLVAGPRGSGLAAILAETGVSVELPFDTNEEQILLRGRPENLGRALSMVYERAESSVMKELTAPNRFHKLLIGKRGATLAEICEGYERVNVDFGDANEDRILIEGPPEEVAVIVERLRTRITELEATMAIDRVRVDPKYFRHIIGRHGATILRLRENNVQIHLPTMERGDTLAADEIVIEGDPDGIVKAKAEILLLVQKLENEKCKDVIIEQRIQQLLLTGHKGPPPIRSIYDTFPKVSFVWPASSSTDDAMTDLNNPHKSVVQLRGDRQQVDAAAERLSKLVKQVVEENHRQEIRILKEFRPHIFGRGSSRIQKLLDDTQTRMQYPNPLDDSDVFTLIGREEHVQQAITQLEDLQKNLANVKEIVVSIPSALTTKFVGNQAPSLRSICDQCVGVHMRFLNPKQNQRNKTNQVEVVMIGPSEALQKAQELIDQLNAKVAQLCAEELVHVDPKFHGFLIGRQGANITRFRERHNVELLFPDRIETDPKLAMEIRIVGSKDAVALAKDDLNILIKSIEDEVEDSVQVDSSLLRDLLDYRRAFPEPDLGRIRLIMPKTMGRSTADCDTLDDPEPTVPTPQMTSIKLIGQKACVETAAQVLRSMISDIKEQVTKEYPVTDASQFSALERARSQFREMERNSRVFITLRRPLPPVENGLPIDPSNSSTSTGMLIITGRAERCDLVYENEIKPLLPIEEEFPLIKEFHRSLISVPMPERERRERRSAQPPARGKKPQEQQRDDTEVANETQSKATEVRQKHGVFIRLPPQQDMEANFVILRGTPNQIESAKTELTEWIKQCEELRTDRIARSYEASVQVPARFIQALVQLRPKLTAAHDIQMRFGAVVPAAVSHTSSDEMADVGPLSTATEEAQELIDAVNGVPDAAVDEESSVTPIPAPCAVNGTAGPVKEERMTTAFLRGYKQKVDDATQELEAAIAKLLSQVTENLFIPAEVHSYLIGSRGFAVQKVMQEYNVRIEFPNRNNRESGDTNTVLVTGDELDVDRACDFLIGRANDLVHSYLIGSRGFAVQKVMQEYNVRIEFPNRNNRESGDTNTVLVTGDELDVDRACDFLIGRANDLMDRFGPETRTSKQKQQVVEIVPSNAD